MKKLKIKSMKKGYCDRDLLLLHANFQILKDFVEKEEPQFEQKEKNGKTILELYNWWEVRRTESFNLPEDKEGTYEFDTKQLIRLMKVRESLWT